jgi:hypothetical protein
MLYPPDYRAARVTDELSVLIKDPSYSAAAERVAGLVKQEGGAPAACDALERAFVGAHA